MFDLAEAIIQALKTGKGTEILQFGDFKITKKLGRGQQGIVLKARSPNDKEFAIKLYCPRDEHPAITGEGRDRFVREAAILLKLKHRNIANVYAGGSAKWDISAGKWLTSSDFASPGETPFYVMDFISGESVKSLFYRRFSKKNHVIDPAKCTPSRLNLFEQLVTQISEAMYFFHNKGIVHRDIKPHNIIYSKHDNTFVIVDFGFARYFKRGPRSLYGVILETPYVDRDSWEKGTVDHLNDQFMFASMILEVLEGFRSIYTGRNYNGIKSSLEKATLARNQRYGNMSDLKKAVEPCLYSYPYRNYYFQTDSFLVPFTRFGHFDQNIRIPFSGSIPFFSEALHIVDTNDFQRLRGVRQLGPTQFVYPGAGHTRFEHSLGTYYLSLKYLEVLLKNPIFYEAVEDVEEAVKLVVLGALLHDVGHHPFSHWIEEMRGLPQELGFAKHEERAKEIILDREIGKVITKEWEVDPELVCKLISGSRLSRREELLNSIIDSDIDVDKIDYLQRDSAHCGVPYGVAFDVERLISSLWVNEGRNKICLTDKGRSSFVALLVSNIIMYQEVYWHKTTRVCTAMFKRFFYDFLTKEIAPIKTVKREYLFYSDDRFIETLYTRAKRQKEQKLATLIQPFANRGRVLYKPGYVHYHGRPLYISHRNTMVFFERLAKLDYPGQIEMTSCLLETLRKSEFPEMEEYDIIIETTPVDYREVALLRGFQFYDSKLGKYESITPEIDVLNKYLESNRRSYVFCKPKYYEKMIRIVKNGKLNDMFGQVLEQTSERRSE